MVVVNVTFKSGTRCSDPGSGTLVLPYPTTTSQGPTRTRSWTGAGSSGPYVVPPQTCVWVFLFRWALSSTRKVVTTIRREDFVWELSTFLQSLKTGMHGRKDERGGVFFFPRFTVLFFISDYTLCKGMRLKRRDRRGGGCI